MTEFEKYRRKLERATSTAFPEAVAEAINQIAGYAHVQSLKNIRKAFALRTKYTENSVKFWAAKPRPDYRKINAITGTVSPYLPVHDTGGQKPKGKAVPTLAARGGIFAKKKQRKYYLGQDLDQRRFFVGVPRGKTHRTYGIYERGKDRKLRLIHAILPKLPQIRGVNWHNSAVKQWGKKELFEREFPRAAEAALRKIK